MKKDTEKLLEKAVEQVKGRTGDSEQLNQSASRAWQEIERHAGNPVSQSGSHVSETGCARFSRLVPAYHNGTLDEAQSTLLREHMRECFSCKSKLRRLQSAEKAPAAAMPVRRTPAWLKWGSIAAGLMLMVLAAQFMFWAGMLPGISADAITVNSMQGIFYSLSGREIMPVSAGDVFSYGETLKTGPETAAVVTLRDGSELELAPRTEFDVVGGWQGDTVRLNRGNIIIRASDQGSGRLKVLTGDCDVAVKGTIFSVRHGLKGSRVSVVEGEVWVKKNGDNTVLNAGQQYTSRAGLAPRAVAEEVAWSRNSSEYLEMLAAVSDLHRAIENVVMSEELRYNSGLARLLPQDTFIYAAAPNVVDRAESFFQAVEDAIADNPRLSEGWNSEEGLELQSHLDELKNVVYGLEGVFGDEFIMAVSRITDSDPLPVILAESRDNATLVAEIEALNDRIAEESEGIRPFAVIDDPFADGLPDPPLLAWCGDGLFAMSPSLELLQQIAEADGSEGTGGFAENPLYEVIASQYDQGVDWILAVDFPSVADLADAGHEMTSDEEFVNPFRSIGSMIAKRKLVNGEPENQIIFSFTEEPTGPLAWLAEPMPMGAMDFVSPDACIAAGVSMQDPVIILDEMLEYMADADDGSYEEFADLQDEIGLDIRNDIAASMGGEALFALDGALLPSPAWKVILEVYDETSLQNSIEYLLSMANTAAEAGEDGHQLVLQKSPVGGSTLYSLTYTGSDITVYYMFVRGYMILAPEYSIIDKAIQYQSTGYSLVNSPDFIASLPSGESVDLSAFYYHDFRSILDTVKEMVNTDGVEAFSFLADMEDGPAQFMSGLYRTDSELVISSNNDLQDCLSILGVVGAFADTWEEKAEAIQP